MKFDIDFEFKAEGLCLYGNEVVTLEERDPNKLDVTAANKAAYAYKAEMADCRKRYGSRRNINKVLSIANWECYTHPLISAIDDVCEALEKLERKLKPCDYVERYDMYSLTEGRPARRSYDEWKKAFLYWCFNTPLDEEA